MAGSYDTNHKRHIGKPAIKDEIHPTARYDLVMTRPQNRLCFLACALAALSLVTAGVASEAVFAKEKTSPTAQQLLGQVGSLSAEIAKIRGLSFKRPMNRVVVSKTQINARILERFHQRSTKSQLNAKSIGMKRFGLIPDSVDYTKMLSSLKRPIASFYDRQTKKLLIAAGTNKNDLVLAREIDHALQDQHFDLTSFLGIHGREQDALLARAALVQGDGIALMIEHKLASAHQPPPWGNSVVVGAIHEQMKGRARERTKMLPLYIRESLRFPYSAGLEFVANIRKHSSWAVVDAIYAKPPLSTEQIIHPSKYDSYERPHVITAALPRVGLPNYSEVISTVQGEKGLELLLRTHGVDEARAMVAVAGWGGDRMAVYTKRKQSASSKGAIGVSLSSWDTENDAVEFYEALEHALPMWSGSSREPTTGVLQFKLSDGTSVYAQRRGMSVLLIVGASNDRLAPLTADVWSHWSVTK